MQKTAPRKQCFSVTHTTPPGTCTHVLTTHCMWWSHQLFWVSPLIITVELVTLTLFCFLSEFVMTMSVIFCKTDHSKKSRDIVTDQAMVANMSWACIGHTNRSEYHRWLSQLSTWRWYGFCLSQIFFMTLTVTFCSTDLAIFLLRTNLNLVVAFVSAHRRIETNSTKFAELKRGDINPCFIITNKVVEPS